MREAVREAVIDEERDGPLAQAYTTLCSPVAGGSFWRMVYLLAAAILSGYFVFGLVQTAPNWADKVTDLSTEFQEQIAFPDVYLCLPSNVIRDLRSLPGRAPVTFNGGVNCREGPSLVGPSLTEAPNDEKFEMCTGRTSTSDLKNYKISTEGLPTDTYAETLANLLPKKQRAEEVFSPVCLVHRISDPTQKPTHKEKVGMLSTFEIAATFNDPVYFEVFLTQPGVPPFDATGEGITDAVLNATSAFLPGQGFMSIVDMSLTLLTDTTQGHKQETWLVQPLIVPALRSTSQVGELEATHVFRWSSHIVTIINIRRKTFSEVMSEIGGLWAIVPLVLGLLFMPSGRLEPRSQKEAYIFKWLPGHKRDEMLEDLRPKDDGDTAAAAGPTGTQAQDNALSRKVDELLARMGAVDGGGAGGGEGASSLQQRIDQLQQRIEALELASVPVTSVS